MTEHISIAISDIMLMIQENDNKYDLQKDDVYHELAHNAYVLGICDMLDMLDVPLFKKIIMDGYFWE